MRATYRVLALLIAAGVVVQAAFIAGAWFQVLNAAESGAVPTKKTCCLSMKPTRASSSCS